jgi:hypothetical protein
MPKRNLTKQELLELGELNKLIGVKKWELSVITKGQELIYNGKKVIRHQTELVGLFEKARDSKCGYPKDSRVKIDLKTGKLKEVKNENSK